MVHSSIIHSIREGKISHISVEFEGQWIHSFNKAEDITYSAVNMKTKSGCKLLMFIIEIPIESMVKAAKNSFWIARDGVGLRMGTEDINVLKTTKLRRKKA
ncbi:MAG: hypothetical protein DRP42_06545 [Tenericutes bacterium]|nr:MAG: hypothetical protein DRP42_06545 [Mycoplasmatota bacterium]